MTESPMTAGIVSAFKKDNLFWQSPGPVASIVVGLIADTKVCGKAVYVEGGDGWEFEDSFEAAKPQWLGEEPTRRMRANDEVVKSGALLRK
jgi:hypothetical protein